MIDLVKHHRIQWVKDAVDEVAKERADIPLAFMAIRRVLTPSQNNLTFAAERSESTGHADVFFAISHAVCKEPVSYDDNRPSVWAFGKAA
ncbi:terminase-like family protein, partial [Salmonella enterica]|nr:terminase-like family protein [Salmonella enterica]